VSQSYLALQASLLFIEETRDGAGMKGQLYARAVPSQLWILRRCAEMEARETARLEVAEADRNLLADEIAAFDQALPDLKNARDMLEHPDDYAYGQGRLQKAAVKKERLDLHEAAALYWGGGYDSTTDVIEEGPYKIHLGLAVEAAQRLHYAIYRAAKAIDRRPRDDGESAYPTQ
jgi:hypothetical protein